MIYYQIKKEQSHNFLKQLPGNTNHTIAIQIHGASFNLRVLRTPVHPIVNVIGHRLKASVFCYGSNPPNPTEEFSDLVRTLFLGSI